MPAHRNQHGRSGGSRSGFTAAWTREGGPNAAIEFLRGLALGIDPLSARAEAKVQFMEQRETHRGGPRQETG